MPWKENRAMDLRVQLIQDYDEGEGIQALAEIYDVARKAIYKSPINPKRSPDPSGAVFCWALSKSQCRAF
jgi:hypothetical protein